MKKNINVINLITVLTLVGLIGSYSIAASSFENFEKKETSEKAVQSNGSNTKNEKTNRDDRSAQDKSLRKFIQMGLANSLGIQSQNKRMLQAEFKRKDAWAGLLPTISMSAGRSYDRAESVNSDTVEASSTVSNSLKVSGNWVLWDNTANYGKIVTAKYDESSEQYRTEKTQQTFVLSVLDSYLEHLLLIKRKELIERYLEQSRKTHSESLTLVKIGAKTSVETIDTEIQVLEAERDLMEASSSLKNSERSLRALVNWSEQTEIPIVNIFDIQPYFNDSFVKNYAEIKNKDTGKKIENSLNEKLSKLSVLKSAEQLRQAKWGYWPKLTLNLSHEWNMSDYLDQNKDPKYSLQSSSVAIGLSWTLWDWFSSARSLKSSEYDHQINMNSYLDEHRQLASDVENAIEQYDINERSLKTTFLALSKARTQLDQSIELYKLGRVTLFLMQQSMNRVFEAEIAYAQRVKNQILLRAKILSYCGYSLDPNAK